MPSSLRSVPRSSPKCAGFEGRMLVALLLDAHNVRTLYVHVVPTYVDGQEAESDSLMVGATVFQRATST